MRPLRDHLILYDEECPMCTVYTKAFVKTGMLDSDGRASYQQMPPVACPVVDKQRAANEIALVNTQTGEVIYGIHSLFAVLGNAFPLFRKLFVFPPFVWLMNKLYAFISYNRRVIIPPRHSAGHAVQPAFKLNYRIAYLALTWFATAAILSRYAPLLVPLVPTGHPGREYAICGGQLLIQAAVLCLLAAPKMWDYLGNMMTVSFAGALLLLPPALLHRWLAAGPYLYAGYFMGVASLMLLEHMRRTKRLKLGWLPTITWVCYRLAILFLLYF